MSAVPPPSPAIRLGDAPGTWVVSTPAGDVVLDVETLRAVGLAPVGVVEQAHKPLRPEGLSPDVLAIDEVRARLGGCSRSRVYELLAAGDLDRSALPSKTTYVTRASVERYERSRGVTPRRTAPRPTAPRPTAPVKATTAPTGDDLARWRADLERRKAALQQGR